MYFFLFSSSSHLLSSHYSRSPSQCSISDPGSPSGPSSPRYAPSFLSRKVAFIFFPRRLASNCVPGRSLITLYKPWIDQHQGAGRFHNKTCILNPALYQHLRVRTVTIGLLHSFLAVNTGRSMALLRQLKGIRRIFPPCEIRWFCPRERRISFPPSPRRSKPREEKPSLWWATFQR